MTSELGQRLMDEYADATGVSGKASPRRYLWTDAFAVCNFLGLYRETACDLYLKFALELVHQVQHVLGRHRSDDSRHGWISGLPEEDGERHPTRGGLRIGKQLNERAADQPMDPRLEWEQDGQYFDYLTKWMHALLRVSQETAEDCYLVWAAELAAAAHRAFTVESPPGRAKQRMVWKMSIDLSRPLVASMGHHDPLDGLVTFLELQVAERFAEQDRIDLALAVADMTEMCRYGRWTTDDPLGIGGLLDDAARLVQMVFKRGEARRDLLLNVLRDLEKSLQAYSRSTSLNFPAEHRLAFRELGLSIGLRQLSLIGGIVSNDTNVSSLINTLLEYRSLADQTEVFWSRPAHRQSTTWLDHRDINSVMLAASLAPDGLLGQGW